MLTAGNFLIGLGVLECLAVVWLLLAPGRDLGSIALVFVIGVALFLTCSSLYCILIAAGKLDAIGLPRLVLYPGAVVTCFCLVVFMGSALTLTQTKTPESSVILNFFGPHASWIVPALMLLLSFLLLHHNLVPRIPESVPRGLLFALGLIGIGVAVTMYVEGVNNDEKARKTRIEAERTAQVDKYREKLTDIQQADPVTGFGVLLECTGHQWPPDVRQLATQKMLSNGPKFAPLLMVQLRTGDEERARQFLLDNDPPDAKSLAEPARAAILRIAAKVREQDAIIFATDFERWTGLILKVADTYSSYGVDFVPAILDYRAALDTPGKAQLYQPPECRKTVDAWLANRKG